ncbi:MAG: hypothetical protein MUE69_05730 [Myxococcota bacterium]|jgi:hypothetical protein|nr:hypothetical protein [Myxococcota bacterium]
MLFGLGGGDIWWHVASGRHVVEHLEWIRTDPFAYTSQGPVRYAEWLAQVIDFGAWKVAGEPGLVLLHALLVTVIALVSYRGARRKASDPATVATVILAVVASHPALAAKPQIFSYLGFALSLRLVARLELESTPLPSRGLTAATFVVFVAWANLHRGGLLGVATLGAVAFHGLVLRNRVTVSRAGLLALLAVGSLCINPYGTAYLTSAFDVVGRSSLRDFVAEWQPMSLESLTTRHFTLIPLVALFLFGRRARPFDAGLWIALGTGFLAWRGARLTPFLALALVPDAARGLDVALSKLTRVRPSVRSLSVCALAVASLVYSYASRFSPAYVRLGVVDSRVPVDLVDFLARGRPRGNVLNPVDFGGYLLFRLGPGGEDTGEEPLRTFVDGRYDTVFSNELCLDAFLAPTDPVVFQRVVSEREITWVAHRWNGFDDPSFAFLDTDPNWRIIYWDDVGVVRVRNDRSLEPAGYRELRPSTVLPRLDARTPELEREILEHAVRVPRSAAAQLLAAEVLARAGNHTEALAARSRAESLMASRRPLLD